ncbi:MSMEG_6728 family protein [Streptomyces sp. ODS05-4]|uniref:MSMEG_6728 family protein n=1 Tax=Streptomyces sp. ODS05-4 TaxID=2944939 RepID=UPI00210A8106|nr:MSMEG_6728 family protein [Streptomyces sp. ODS05-4]
MQTFLPFPGFTESAEALDPRRLGKQRVEAVQVWRGLTVPGYGWRRHPAVRMWRGYEEALVRYGLEVCAVWTAAGRADTCAAMLRDGFAAWREGDGRGDGVVAVRGQEQLAAAGELPPWLGLPEFHRSHRSRLLGKDPDFYRARFPGDPDDLPYVWPSSDRDPEA